MSGLRPSHGQSGDLAKLKQFWHGLTMSDLVHTRLGIGMNDLNRLQFLR